MCSRHQWLLPGLENYSFRYLREETPGELICLLSEWVPANERSGHTPSEVWHDQDEYRKRNIDFYDKVGKHLEHRHPNPAT